MLQEEREETLILKDGPMALKSGVEIKEIQMNKIKLAKNSRMNVTDEEISGLMSSIKEVGLLQPIGVTKTSTGGFEIVYGNRRFMAVSKLGLKKIPAVIHANKKEAENDIQNLTENLQRRNISLTEAGRYMGILQKQGLTQEEIAARLGVSPNYIKQAMIAFSEVPARFRGDLEVKTTNDRKVSPGKIAITTANAIVNAGKSFGLTKPQQEFLFGEAKTNPEFDFQNVKKYAAAMVEGEKNPVKAVPKLKHVTVGVWMDESEYNRLYSKYITKGEFTSFGQVIVAILRGQKPERVKIK